MEGCYCCTKAEFDPNGVICGINGMLIDEPSLGCNKRVSKKHMTNGDLIRQMTDEELARFLDRTCGCSVCFLDIMVGECASFKSSKDCIANKVKWLKQVVNEAP